MALRSRPMHLQGFLLIFEKFGRSYLRSAIPFDLKRGYRCTFGTGWTMRCCSFQFLKILNLYFQSNHMSTQKLVDVVSLFEEAVATDRLKVAKSLALSVQSSIEDFIEHDQVWKESVDMNYSKKEIDFVLATARYPCITLGDSSIAELYDEVQWKSIQLKPLTYPFRAPLPTINSIEQSLPILLHDSPALGAADGTEVDKKISGKEISANAKLNQLNSEVQLESILDSSVKFIPDTTHKHYCQLEEHGFHTVRKLLHHFPRTYADLQNAYCEIDDGAYQNFVGMIFSSKARRARSFLSFLDVIISCEFVDDHGISKNIYLHLKRFFSGVRFTCQPFLRSLQSKYRVGALVHVSGKVKKMHCADHYEMREHSIDLLEEEQNSHVDKRPYPFYPAKAKLKPLFLKDTISRALKILSTDIDPMPKEILEEFNLPNLFDAYLWIHRPNNFGEADLARRRLNFDEFFYIQLGRLFQMLNSLGSKSEKKELLYQYQCNKLSTTPMEEWSSLTKSFLNALPYSLTPSQLHAVSEIIWDLKRPVPMNRLLQGDVGCGKTVVAFLACMEVIASGFQAAFMVPTELVAFQHYEHIISLLKNLMVGECKPSVVLLTRSTPSKESKMILKGLRAGDINMVIGTHSLIADKVEFSALRFTVIDEQHRFGVIQRGKFNSKLYSASPCLSMSSTLLHKSIEETAYMAPHILTMTATPIPRTLALAIYGDMSLTQITDLPPGRTVVETFVLEANEVGFENAFQMMHDDLLSGGKIYLVYPIIEKSKHLPQLQAARKEFESISNKFDGYSCGLLHGRMNSTEKSEAWEKFKSGETQVLLATHVIEVGVDVPDASMIVVMNSERFGIAQLHQLRGRVGRGKRKSKCIFFASTSGALNRLKILEKSSDGFNLSIADLRARGPGNLLGKKQSGYLPEFPIARLDLDGNILKDAQLVALKILSASYDLSCFPKLRAELSMRKPLCILGD